MTFPAGCARMAAVATLILSLAACGGNPSPTPTPTEAAGSAPATVSASPSVSSSSAPSASPAEPASFDPRGLEVRFEPVAEGFDRPLAAVHAGDGSDRLFVVEQGGRIVIVRDGRRLSEPFLDIADLIVAGGEQGLLGLAFHPRFPDDPRLFVNYTEAEEGDTIISSFQVADATADRADPASEEVLLRIGQPFANHNGGALAFGPDGFLYIATGDGGSGGDPMDNGQRTDTLLGKILRIDVDATGDGRPYGIPADNPFVEGAGEPEIWHYGLRNPWRMSFDRETGDLWIGDVGQSAWEEIDVHRAGTPGGVNFGWARREGGHCVAGQQCDEGQMTDPIAEYGHGDGCTVIGGYVYRGSTQPALLGGYLFADYCSGQVWAIDAAALREQEPIPIGTIDGNVSSFGEDEAGELYVTTLNGGELLRVVSAG